MQFRSLEEIEECLQEDGVMLEQSPQKSDVENNEDATAVAEEERKLEEMRKLEKKRKLEDEESQESLPLRYRHVRDSERKVKEVIYRAIAKLMGKGLSLHEATLSVMIVANTLFDRNWKEIELSDQAEDVRDKMPSARSIREAMALMETEALAHTVDMMGEGRQEGRMVTHAIDSTTKKSIGQFATQGI